jgi:hypothetical protein
VIDAGTQIDIGLAGWGKRGGDTCTDIEQTRNEYPLAYIEFLGKI